MPIINNNLESHTIIGSNYGYSAKRLDDLGATEYTLVALSADCSGSVINFATQIEDCITKIAKACVHSPRADNLMIRLTRFNDRVDEIHGFKPLSEIDVHGYSNVLKPSGTTALYDSAFNAIESVSKYGNSLYQHDFDVNGIVFVITDGMDNASKATALNVKDSINQLISSEKLESIVTVLVGVNSGSQSQDLKKFSNDVGFNKYIEIQNADASSLSKLAEFVSNSISLQSKSLGSSKASPLLNF